MRRPQTKRRHLPPDPPWSSSAPRIEDTHRFSTLAVCHVLLHPIALLSTLDQLVRSGKIRYIGGSNFSGWHLMKSLAVADRYGFARYVAYQAYYSLLNRDFEWDLAPLGVDQGVGTVVWSPLGWGKLTGKIRRDRPAASGTRAHTIAGTGPVYPEERLFRIIDTLNCLSGETGKAIPQIALNWLLRKPTVATLILGARDEEQLVENIGAVGWSLTPAQVAMLDAASDAPTAYPTGHQRDFPQLNERTHSALGLSQN